MNETVSIPMTIEHFTGVDAFVEEAILEGEAVLKAIKNPMVTKDDEPTFARLNDIADFSDGTIEVKVLSRLLPDAPAHARGFIGVAFRINETNTTYESIYVRPLNARCDDQLRRNHSIQYYSYPDYKFDKLREIAHGKYEAYADMEFEAWTDLRIEVDGPKALLYVNNASQPSLIVNDMFLGPDSRGGIGLWVEIGTEGYFKDLKITKR